VPGPRSSKVLQKRGMLTPPTCRLLETITLLRCGRCTWSQGTFLKGGKESILEITHQMASPLRIFPAHERESLFHSERGEGCKKLKRGLFRSYDRGIGVGPQSASASIRPIFPNTEGASPCWSTTIDDAPPFLGRKGRSWRTDQKKSKNVFTSEPKETTDRLAVVWCVLEAVPHVQGLVEPD